MRHIRVSVTDLDAYRYFLENEGDVSKFLAQMRREAEATPAMKGGSAFHDALENAVDGEFEVLTSGDYRFAIIADIDLQLPDIREMKGTKVYEIDDVAVTLVGKVDAIIGRTIYDHKLTGSYAPDRFLSGYQWRAYLDIFEADMFAWNVFEGRPSKNDEFAYRVTRFHQLGAARYPGMTEDLANQIRAFVEMAETHLPEKFTAKAA